jgi:hypothetical protein
MYGVKHRQRQERLTHSPIITKVALFYRPEKLVAILALAAPGQHEGIFIQHSLPAAKEDL